MGIGLQIDIEEIDNKIILRLDGRLDTTSAPMLEKKTNSLIEDNRNIVVLDFSRIDYLSSAGLRVILSVTKKLKAKNGALVIFSINDDVMEIIKTAGFEKVLNICGIEAEALRFDTETK
jgi:anti-sigma B factor antagonist/stage II sporulation protein AA (anti-sigma F factor antagonist)